MKATECHSAPVVLAADDFYAPLLGVAMASVLDHAPAGRIHEVVVLENGLSEANRRRLLAVAGGRATLRFVDVGRYMRDLDPARFHVSEHISIATYYRFFLPEILAEHDRALYLDCDMIALDDVSALLAVDLGDNLLAAAPDLTMRHHLAHGGAGLSAAAWEQYLTDVLGLRDPKGYFQAGALVMNLERMRAEDFTRRCLERLREIGRPRYWDQCVLNSLCRGRAVRLDASWNVMWMLGGHPELELAGIENALPEDCREEFARSRARPRIVHYFTNVKAWMRTDAEFSDHFWGQARRTPFYEEMLSRYARSETERVLAEAADSPASAVPARIKANRAVEERHALTFGPYRDANRGRDLAVVATGPSLAHYQPLTGALHLGVNRAFLKREIRFDYLFAQAFPGIDEMARDLAAYGGGETRKFLGLAPAADAPRWVRPGLIADAPDFAVYYCLDESGGEALPFVADIENYPLSASGSVVFSALQFALYTRPARLFLVGCDATGKGTAAGTGGETGIPDEWRRFADFARRYYPEVEIVSVNPVRLAGLFRDLTP